jgi:hypothetical protein
MADWWQGFQADADAVDRAIGREYQAAVDDGRPWPPERRREAGYEGRHAAAPRRDSELEQSPPRAAGSQTDPGLSTSEPETPSPEATEPGLADYGRAARLDELQARADEVARRIDAQRAELAASSEHAARIQREAQAQPEAGRQAETPHDMEMEL